MNRIGFFDNEIDNCTQTLSQYEAPICDTPRKSVVRVHFFDKGTSLFYYNDQFDLKFGDLVYVDGKFEGVLGRVTEVNYNFKIKLSEYKKVVYLVDTDIHGKLYGAGSHFVTFDPSVLPIEQIRAWFISPLTDCDDYVSGSDGKGFPLKKLDEMKIAPQIAERGNNYYHENLVRYISLNGESGYAIVSGSHPYEVEFKLKDGVVSDLNCTCLCSYNCKHEFAAMLQLNETLDIINKNYSDKFLKSGYFAAINKVILFSYAVDGDDTGCLTL